MKTEMQTLSHSELKRDPAMDAIRMIYLALKSDYPEFSKIFSGGLTPSIWARRFYGKVSDCDPGTILDGYEKLIQQIPPGRMPKLGEIVQSILNKHRALQQHEQIEQTARELEYSGGLSGYVEALDDANKDNPVAQREIAKMREILARPAPKTAAEARQRREQALKDHEALIAKHRAEGKIKRRANFHGDPLCSVNGCENYGTMTRSVTGSEVWYCGKHFWQKS